jgi:hypothetical protein
VTFPPNASQTTRFRLLMEGYGGHLPLRDMQSSIDFPRIECAVRAVHDGWLRIALAANKSSLIFVFTDEGRRIFLGGDP